MQWPRGEKTTWEGNNGLFEPLERPARLEIIQNRIRRHPKIFNNKIDFLLERSSLTLQLLLAICTTFYHGEKNCAARLNSLRGLKGHMIWREFQSLFKSLNQLQVASRLFCRTIPETVSSFFGAHFKTLLAFYLIELMHMAQKCERKEELVVYGTLVPEVTVYSTSVAFMKAGYWRIWVQ